MERQEAILGSLHQSESLNVTSVYGRYKSLKTLSIFYEQNDYFYANMSCSSEVTYIYEMPINFLKENYSAAPGCNNKPPALFTAVITISETRVRPVLEDVL